MFDPTISLGSIITLATVLIGGWIALRTMVASLAISVESLGDRVHGLEDDIKALNRVVTSNAIIEERVAALRSEFMNFATTQMAAHTEWRGWVRKNFEKVEADLKEVDLKAMARQISQDR